MNQGKKLTDNIIRLIASDPPLKHDGKVDVDAIMNAVASAFAGLACSLHTKEQAKELLVTLADLLDNPATFASMAAGIAVNDR
jgi:hypothetical protein